MNKSRKLLSAIIALMAFVPVFAAGVSYTQYVNPLIGTGGHGHVFLGANVPFGFVQLGPTQPTRGWDWCSGYHYSDSVLVGFSHQHLSGTGIGDLGDITLLPVKNAMQNHVFFTHQAETAVPGYYSVKLNEPNVMVELTATQRVGMHRYTFGGNEHRGLFRLDLKRGVGWDNLVESKFTLEKPTMITGYRLSSGWAKRQQVFFAAEFSKPVTVVSTEGDSIAVIAVDDVSQPLLVKVALSPVSIANAKENLLAELPGWDFVQTYKKADEAWNDELAKILIETIDDEAKRVFYTALFHTMTAPSVFCDVNGEYYGSDGKTHHADFTNYTTLSLWDTYRAAHPLMTLIHPERQHDIASTFINIYRQQGKLPVWHLMGNETDCMVGNPGIPVLADLVIKGYVDDKEAAYEAMKASAMADERGLALLKEYGYLPYDKEPANETVAKGLEYALADACVAKVAQLLGKQQDAKYFSQRSQLYRRLFDKERQFMRALDSKGQFRPLSELFDPIRQHSDYTEGNAWQYIWLVPHDVKGLIGLFGGDKPFVEKLDSLFIVEGDLGENAAPDISGLIGQYAHGNEPSHHVIYLYNYAGMPWKGAPLLRKTMKEMYSDNPDGLSGNEDVGQMSAWYVLSSIGLYQVEPAGGVYVIGSPLFDNATIEVGGGRTFTVTTRNNSPENCYVQSVRLNGKPYAYSYITFADIMKGGVMEVTMGPQPSKWGTATGNRPPSLLDKGRKIRTYQR